MPSCSYYSFPNLFIFYIYYIYIYYIYLYIFISKFIFINFYLYLSIFKLYHSKSIYCLFEDSTRNFIDFVISWKFAIMLPGGDTYNSQHLIIYQIICLETKGFIYIYIYILYIIYIIYYILYYIYYILYILYNFPDLFYPIIHSNIHIKNYKFLYIFNYTYYFPGPIATLYITLLHTKKHSRAVSFDPKQLPAVFPLTMVEAEHCSKLT